VGPLLTGFNRIHPVDEPPLPGGIDWGFLNWLMYRWDNYHWMVFRGRWFGFPPVTYQGPLVLSFGWYFVGFCLVFLLVTYLGAVYLLFGWYSVGCFVLFTSVLSFGYCHMAFHTLPGYRMSSVSILFYVYPMVCASLPVACAAHPVEMKVWRSRSSWSSGMQVMEIWIKVFFQREQSYGDPDQSLRPAGTKLRRSKCSPSGIQVMEIWIKVFVQREQN